MSNFVSKDNDYLPLQGMEDGDHDMEAGVKMVDTHGQKSWLGTLDSVDQKWSNMVGEIDNIFCNWFFGFWAWIFNRK